MRNRRTLLQGLAALPLAAVPAVAVSSRALAGSADPFTTYHQRIVDLHAAIAANPGDAEAERLMDTWGDIDNEALAARPATLAGAVGALEYARREFHQFRIETLEEMGSEPDSSDRLVLRLIDGALGVLRNAAGGARG